MKAKKKAKKAAPAKKTKKTATVKKIEKSEKQKRMERMIARDKAYAEWERENGVRPRFEDHGDRIVEIRGRA